MFFTRLAIAALSLGSVVKVFAAPVAIGLAAPPAAAVVEFDVPSGMERRLDLPFSVMVDQATATIDAVGAEIDGLKKDAVDAVNAKLGSTLLPLIAEVKALTQKTQVAGVKDSLLLAADGVTKLSIEEVGSKVSEMLTVLDSALSSVKELHALNTVEAELNDIKTELATFKSALLLALPDVLAIVDHILALLFATLGDILAGILDGVITI